MKLVELLVKEIKEWPEDVTYFVQDCDREVKAGIGSELSNPTDSGVWIRHITLDSYNFYSDLCTDWQTSVVTKDIYTKHKEETQMKQIIVNVGGLPAEEKHRVNEALVKIKNISSTSKITNFTDVEWFYADGQIAWSYGEESWAGLQATHTPQQVLEMAGIAPTAEENVILADTLIITDSLGNLVYDSTLDALNLLNKQRGHIHAELMAQYAEDAKTHSKPWELWQFLGSLGWSSCGDSPRWNETKEYRRKPKSHTVHGVEVPDLRVSPELGAKYYLADPTTSELAELHTFVMRAEKLWAERGLCYQNTEEGKQAAILHAKAMLDIA